MEHAPPVASYTVSGLEPASFYKLRVTAHNKRGATVTVFQASTLTEKGEVLTLPYVMLCSLQS
jgi:hypothetical protein